MILRDDLDVDQQNGTYLWWAFRGRSRGGEKKRIVNFHKLRILLRSRGRHALQTESNPALKPMGVFVQHALQSKSSTVSLE